MNYLAGNDPANWHTGLSTYGEVVYKGLWPGIDMAFRGRAGTLTYEFLVQPGARVKDIRLAYVGAKKLSLDPAGTMLISTPLGTLRDAGPMSYQRIAGRRVSVDSRYALTSTRYGFTLGIYDSRFPLVIDPGLAYSTYLGGIGFDLGISIAVDEQGNAYVAGDTLSTAFPTTPGAFQSENAGDEDVFVAKLDPAGSALVYSTYLGGTALDFADDIAVDGQGNAYVGGGSESTDFPTTRGAFQATDPDPTAGDAGDEGFVTKLAPSGSALVYSTYLGGPGGEDSINGIAVDKGGNAYVAGAGCTSDYPTTPGAFQATDPTPGPCNPADSRPDHNTGLVSKLNPSGSALVYSTYLGGKHGFVNINGMTIDSTGNAYLTGPADGDFPTTPGAFQAKNPAPGTDAFVTKLNAAGSALVYSTFLGGNSTDEGGIGVGVDRNGFTYVAGRTGSTDFPTTPGAYDTTLSGEDDAFVTKLNTSGSALVYSTLLGGNGIDEPHFSVPIGGNGRAYVAGFTTSTDFPTTLGVPQPAYGGGSADAFVTALNPSGSALVASTYLGGTGSDNALNIALGEDGFVYVTGSTRSTDFPTTPGAFQSSDPDTTGRDGFVTKLSLGDK